MEFFIKEIYPWLADISSASSLLPFITGLFLIGKRKSLQFRFLLLFITLGVAAEIAGQVTVHMGTRNNLWLVHITTPLEFGLLSAVYYHSFKQVFFKRAIAAAVVVFVLFSIYGAFMLEGITQMNSAPKMVANSLLIVMAISYFYKVSNDLNTIYLDRDPVFLLSCGLLIYIAGTSMSHAMFNEALAVSYDAARICLAIFMILNILFNASLVVVLRRMKI